MSKPFFLRCFCCSFQFLPLFFHNKKTLHHKGKLCLSVHASPLPLQIRQIFFARSFLLMDKQSKENLGKLEPLSCSSSCINNYTLIVIYLSIIVVSMESVPLPKRKRYAY